MKKYIIWDIDGTLLDSVSLDYESMVTTMHRFGLPLIDADYLKKNFGLSSLEVLKTLGVPNAEEVRKQWCREFEKISDRALPYPGVTDTLKKLKALGVPMGIVTSRTEDITLPALQKLNFLPLFDCVVTYDDTERHKPTAEPAACCVERLGARPEQCIYVGDASADCACAKAAGVPFLLAGWGTNEREALKDETVIESPNEIFRYL